MIETIELEVEYFRELQDRACLGAAWREMAKVAVEQLAEHQAELEYLRGRVVALIDELRALRDPMVPA